MNNSVAKSISNFNSTILPEQLVKIGSSACPNSTYSRSFTSVILSPWTFTIRVIKYLISASILSIINLLRWLLHLTNNLKFTISFTFIFVVSLIIIYITYTIVKGRILSQYKKFSSNASTTSPSTTPLETPSSTNTTNEQGNQNKNSFNKNLNDDESPLSTFLDQFLSAIKIFGYLEKPVFHDLTKNMKTQKLDEGEILLLDNSMGFAIVVEGTMQIYHKVENQNDITTTTNTELNTETNNRVENGDEQNNISSMYNCSSSDCSSTTSSVDSLDDMYSNLEDLNVNNGNNGQNFNGGNDDMSYNEDEFTGEYMYLKDGLGKYQLLNTVKPGNPLSSLINILKLFTESNAAPFNNTNNNSNNENSKINNNDPTLYDFGKTNEKSSDPNLIHHSPKLSPLEGAIQNIQGHETSPFPSVPLSSHSQSQSHTPLLDLDIPNVVARAATDCTIAIIPPKSFTNLTKKYPRSSAHIIQMVLTKLYHVTFQTAHSYLGLTKEIMQVEKTLNKASRYRIPYYLIKIVMKRFHNTDNYTINNNNKDKNSNYDNRHFKGNDEIPPNLQQTSMNHSRHVVLDSRDHFNPGDLLSNVPLSRKELSPQMPSNISELPNMKNNQPPKSKHSSSSQNTLLSQHPSSINTTSFSSEKDETEDSTVKMALAEAMFSFLGITDKNMSVDNNSSISDLHHTDSSNQNLLHRLSEISLVNSVCSSNTLSANLNSHRSINNNLRILPSSFALTSNGLKYTHRDSSKIKTNNKRKKKLYKEEVSPNLNYDAAKSEFSRDIKLKFYKQGATIVEQNCNGHGLYYVISGKIDVISSLNSESQLLLSTETSRSKRSKNNENILYSVEAGGITGYLSSLVGYRSFVTLKAKTDVYVGFLSNESLELLCDKYFLIYLRIAETLINLLPVKMLKLDHALEWVHISASDTLFYQDDPANGIYVVLNGRLRQFQTRIENNHNNGNGSNKDGFFDSDSVPENSGKTTMIGELAQGESFGEVEVLTAMNRSSTMVAVRDSELARIPRTLFELLALEHPSIMIRITRLVARKILDKNPQNISPSRLTTTNGSKYDFNLMIPPTNTDKYNHSYTANNSSLLNPGTNSYRTITILPITDDLPVESFSRKLVHSFKQVGKSTIGLTQRTTLTHLGKHAFDRLAKLKQSGYFAELEQMYNIVVYIGDTPANSSWTKTCIAQGDCILLLADANSKVDIGEYERLLSKSKTTARKELILLHDERYVEPGLTQKWLADRPWIDSHHHIQYLVSNFVEPSGSGSGINHSSMTLMDKIIQTELGRRTYKISQLLPNSIKNKVENFSSRFVSKKNRIYSPIHSHKNDFLRLARILSGQAIGLVLGGGGARGISHLGVLQAIEEQGIPIDIVGGTSIGSFIGGLYARDYDVVSIYGRIKKFAGRISSKWRMMFDLTWPVTSYTTGHEFNRGIWKTFGDTRIEDFWVQYYCNSTNITESVQEIHSFGYAWRYIRASMSLAGLLPPLEENGSMLLDGGYVDNLPVREMKTRGCNTIFAIDVGSVDDRTPMKYGDSLNGFWIVFNRWNPFSSHPNIPNMAEVQMRLGYVASVNALENAKHTKGVIYARPPIDDFNTLDFAKFEEIYQVGVRYGRLFFQDLVDRDRMPLIPGSKEPSQESDVPELLLHRRNSI